MSKEPTPQDELNEAYKEYEVGELIEDENAENTVDNLCTKEIKENCKLYKETCNNIF